jgi:hypothetical protein
VPDVPALIFDLDRTLVDTVYSQGIDNTEIIDTVHARRAPMIPVSASLRL